MRSPLSLVLAVSFFAACLIPGRAFSQGSLTPPGPPAPTMKTLDQVEPRIPIDATHTPGDAANNFIISQPGSYYLTGNVGVTGTNGIRVAAPGVTVDLNGFFVSRTSGTGGSGVTIASTAHQTTVKNGKIKGFADGVISAFEGSGFAQGGIIADISVSTCTTTGIDVSGAGWIIDRCNVVDVGDRGINTGSGSTVRNCTAVHCGTGIFVGNNSSVDQCVSRLCTSNGFTITEASTVTHCSASENASFGFNSGGVTFSDCIAAFNGNSGFRAAAASVLTKCTATANNGNAGISVGSGSTVIDCSASSNTSTAVTSAGIAADGSSTIRGCTVTGTRNTGAISVPATGSGIAPGDNSLVKDCVVQDNKGTGIRAGNRCTIIDCRAVGNGIGASGAGISGGVRTVVTRCAVTGNAADGINATDESVISENSVSANGVDAAAAGIHTIPGGGSRIEGNQVRANNGVGILGTASDVIIRNTAGGNNGGNYAPSSGANFAPIQTPATATNPLANIVN